MEHKMSRPAKDLIERSLEGIDPSIFVDHHTHIAGIGTGGTDAFVNPRMQSWRHPFHRLKFSFYLSAAGVQSLEDADAELLRRLRELIQHIPAHGKHSLLAFDKHYNVDGSVNLDKTEFYVPNEYVFQQASLFPELFLPVISVHPYRRDAIEELEKWAGRGGRFVKWLPNAMGINPSNPLCDRFYEVMKQRNLILLSHGGEEKAVEAEEDQKLGNPLLLRRALDHGVKVVIAHCASLGTNEDLDSREKKIRPNFDLFLCLMEEPKYEDLVFGEISAMTQFNRAGGALATMLSRTEFHERLINGSDYPLPAINTLIRMAPLVKQGFIRPELTPSLKEIYHFNPLLFDFCLKRMLRHPSTNQQFPVSVFHQNRYL
jgi:predicted TIM-barrel fold metal-dependent hydrolase